MDNKQALPAAASENTPAESTQQASAEASEQASESSEQTSGPSVFSRASSIPMALFFSPLHAIMTTGSYVHDEPCVRTRESSTGKRFVQVLATTPYNAQDGLCMVGSQTLHNIRDGMVAGATEGRPAVKENFPMSHLRLRTIFNPSKKATDEQQKRKSKHILLRLAVRLQIIMVVSFAHVRLRKILEVAWIKRSVIQEAHAQHGTFLIGARFAGLPGLRASHSIQATFDTGSS
jgi:hypothetical protein